jgi:hypothetical protein
MGLGTLGGFYFSPTPIDDANMQGLRVTRISASGHVLMIAVPEPTTALHLIALCAVLPVIHRTR